MKIQSIRTNIAELNKKAYSLKTKKAQAKIYDKIHLLERELFVLLSEVAEQKNNELSGRKMTGIVKRDSKSSEDSVFVYIAELNQSIFIDKCTDIASKSWHSNLSCLEYKENQEVELTIEYSVTRDFKRNEIVIWDIKSLSGGIVDMVEYNRLCNNTQKYSFFKYPNQNGVSGLFA